jgi:hypothetical protein
MMRSAFLRYFSWSGRKFNNDFVLGLDMEQIPVANFMGANGISVLGFHDKRLFQN